MTRITALVCSLIGTAIFWLLMAGPIVALYRGYFDASFITLRQLAGDLTSFPRPDLSMMLTSLVLSLLPMSLFSMLVLTVAQSRWRVQSAEDEIRRQHDQTIRSLQNEGVLKLQWDEPLLADAEFLLSVGAAAGNHAEERRQS